MVSVNEVAVFQSVFLSSWGEEKKKKGKISVNYSLSLNESS